MQAVCLLSGGMDSATATALAVKQFGPDEVLGLSFNYGQRHGIELKHAQQVARQLKIGIYTFELDFGNLLGGSALTDPNIEVPHGHYEAESMKVTVVPNRNAIMLSIAFGVARGLGANWVLAGMHAGDHAIYPDCRPKFVQIFQEMEYIANEDMTNPPSLKTPFIYSTKAEIVRVADGLHLDLGLTYSCYEGNPVHCGKCGTCVERREAFQLAGVSDPTEYAL